uniref:Uncharacterized protein n=1 Tax=Rhizophora mucronata TaxID=61149 RepID=A0A2P2J177_RHIMU
MLVIGFPNEFDVFLITYLFFIFYFHLLDLFINFSQLGVKLVGKLTHIWCFIQQ